MQTLKDLVQSVRVTLVSFVSSLLKGKVVAFHGSLAMSLDVAEILKSSRVGKFEEKCKVIMDF
jgi:hypothetical protein